MSSNRVPMNVTGVVAAAAAVVWLKGAWFYEDHASFIAIMVASGGLMGWLGNIGRQGRLALSPERLAQKGPAPNDSPAVWSAGLAIAAGMLVLMDWWLAFIVGFIYFGVSLDPKRKRNTPSVPSSSRGSFAAMDQAANALLRSATETRAVTEEANRFLSETEKEKKAARKREKRARDLEKAFAAQPEANQPETPRAEPVAAAPMAASTLDVRPSAFDVPAASALTGPAIELVSALPSTLGTTTLSTSTLLETPSSIAPTSSLSSLSSLSTPTSTLPSLSAPSALESSLTSSLGSTALGSELGTAARGADGLGASSNGFDEAMALLQKKRP